MSIDKEIEDFLQEEKRVFKERERETSPCLRKSKGKEKAEIYKTKQVQLREKWKEEKKEI